MILETAGQEPRTNRIRQAPNVWLHCEAFEVRIIFSKGLNAKENKSKIATEA
jgi:hypothetical protein